MDSFDDRGGGRSVAKNLYASDSYDAEEDTWGKLPESKGKLPAESMGKFPGKPPAKAKTASKQNIAEKDQDVAEKVFAQFLHYCSCGRLFISPFLTHACMHIRNTTGHQYLK
jgi:hypothetical protein